MGCEDLLQLLNTNCRENESLSSCIATHMRSCPRCHHGVVQLTKALIADDPFSCEQCRALFPTYYEATRPKYPLAKMADMEMAQMVFHLSHCANCAEEYGELVLLSELEERDEMVDDKR